MQQSYRAGQSVTCWSTACDSSTSSMSGLIGRYSRELRLSSSSSLTQTHSTPFHLAFTCSLQLLGNNRNKRHKYWQHESSPLPSLIWKQGNCSKVADLRVGMVDGRNGTEEPKLDFASDNSQHYNKSTETLMKFAVAAELAKWLEISHHRLASALKRTCLPYSPLHKKAHVIWYRISHYG